LLSPSQLRLGQRDFSLRASLVGPWAKAAAHQCTDIRTQHSCALNTRARSFDLLVRLDGYSKCVSSSESH
jgi:hypothetical protein